MYSTVKQLSALVSLQMESPIVSAANPHQPVYDQYIRR